MKKLLVTVLPLALVAACGSHPPAADNDAAPAGAAVSAPPFQVSEWQAQRARYMDCVKEKADANLSSKGTSRDVAAAAIDACQSQLDTMRDAFRAYLDAQMSSSHGKSSARDAAERVRIDTREKARAYLTKYVEYERYSRAK